MKLHAPVKDFIPQAYPKGDVTQFHGENHALYSTSVCYPLPAGCLQGHNGWDIVRPWGTPIMAVSSGTVVETRSSPDGFGKNVRIWDDDNYEWMYAHLSEIQCVAGTRVERGTVIGLMGNTGFVVSGATPYWQNNPYAGTHLHLGRRKVIPYTGTGTWDVTYLGGQYKGTIQNYLNGFFGSVAFFPEDFEGVVIPTKPKFFFSRNLEFGKDHTDTRQLQKILKYEGLMPETVVEDDHYGNQTLIAVAKYQKRYGIVSNWPGQYFYEITRAHMNKKYG